MILTVSLFASACNVTHFLTEDQALVVKHKVRGLNDQLSSESKEMMLPKPNRKFLFLGKFNTWVYLRSSNISEKSFWTKLRNNIGEAPALFDTVDLNINAERLRQFSVNNGYFKADVEASVKIKRKKAKLYYDVSHGTQYVFGDLIIQDSTLVFQAIKFKSEKSLVKKGEPYSLAILDKERERLVKELKNVGYFFFNKDYIYFEADTSKGNHSVELYLKLKEAKADYVYSAFKIDSIIINPDFNVLAPFFNQDSIHKTVFGNYIVGKVFPVKPIVIENAILFNSGEKYNDDVIRTTQRRLNDLKYYSAVSIRPFPKIDGSNKINIYVLLSKGKKYSTTYAADASTNSISTLGISGSASLSNRNVFRGAEFLDLRILGGVESQPLNNSTLGTNQVFNTLEYGANATFNLPRFAWPFHSLNADKSLVPKSIVSVSYVRQNRLDYERALSSFRFGYEWYNRTNEVFGFYPIEMNLGRTYQIDSVLKELININNDPFLKFTFSDHFTLSSRITYTKNNLNSEKRKKQNFIRVNFEFAGNSLDLISRWISPNEAVPRKILGLPYFQYIKTDLDLRKYLQISKNNMLAGRFYLGIGVPLTNSITLPLEKRYFIGGNNSIRAWQARTLGPGNGNIYSSNSVGQFGDMKIESNLEQRFGLYQRLKGAIFMDAGNVWTFKDTVSSRSEYSNFKFNKFINQIAIGTGFGIRFDFSYFVARLDIGIKLRDPSFLNGNEWVIANIFNSQWKSTDWQKNLIVNPGNFTNKYQFTSINIAVGYPF